MEELVTEIQTKQRSCDPHSGTVHLIGAGVHAIGKKLVEEAAESWMAAEYESDDELALELSQVMYYVAVMAVARGLSLADLYRKL